MGKKIVILITGKKRSGKDTVAFMLNKYMDGSKLMSFAYPMKKIIYDTIGITFKQGEYAKNYGKVKAFLKFWNPLFLFLDIRRVLQIFGTEGMKPWFGNTVWKDLAEKHMNSDVLIISDWRFPEESKWSSDYKIVTVRIEREGLISTDTHASENALNEFETDYTIFNNSTIENLDRKVETLAFKIASKYFEL